jgi:hypothetical protein
MSVSFLLLQVRHHSTASAVRAPYKCRELRQVLQNGQPHTRVLDPTHKHHQWDLGIELTAGRCHLTACHIVALSWCSTSALPKGFLQFPLVHLYGCGFRGPEVLLVVLAQSAFSNQSHDHPMSLPRLGGACPPRVRRTFTHPLLVPLSGTSPPFRVSPTFPCPQIAKPGQPAGRIKLAQPLPPFSSSLRPPRPHFPWRFRPKVSECLSVT